MRLIRFYFLIILFSFSSCENSAKVDLNNKTKEIPKVFIAKSELKLIPEKGQWYYNNLPFNGFSIKKNEKGFVIEKTGFINGKREGIYQRWFDNGVLQKESFYKNNKLVGVTKVWWNTKQLASEFNYFDGIKHGIQRRWYSSGQIFKKRNLNMGKEDGLQQAWLENGKIYVNYEAKNGRIFGMNRVNLCYQLKNEEVQYDKKN